MNCSFRFQISDRLDEVLPVPCVWFAEIVRAVSAAIYRDARWDAHSSPEDRHLVLARFIAT